MCWHSPRYGYLFLFLSVVFGLIFCDKFDCIRSFDKKLDLKMFPSKFPILVFLWSGNSKNLLFLLPICIAPATESADLK